VGYYFECTEHFTSRKSSLSVPASQLPPSTDPVGEPHGDAARAASPDDAIDRVCGAFHGFMRALHSMDRPGWGGLDLTMSQLKTIMLLVETGGLTGRDLAERLGIGASAVTSLVDRLVQRGYARREEDRADRRVTWTRPTEQATALFERLHATHRERLAEVLATLTTEELALVVQAMSTLELAATRQAGVTPRTGTDG
jgi:DNA-binding MarR family transcriptional regulator